MDTGTEALSLEVNLRQHRAGILGRESIFAGVAGGLTSGLHAKQAGPGAKREQLQNVY